MKKFRKLNEEGCNQFKRFLERDANEEAPLSLLGSAETSIQTRNSLVITRWDFENKYEFGVYLCELLADIPEKEIENDYLFWNTMSMLFFDSICYRTPEGVRKVQAMEKWILRKGSQHYHRHLVRSPWLFVKLYKETSKFLLTSSRRTSNQLSMVNDILEQFASRGMLLRNKRVIELFSKMYFDEEKQLPKYGLRSEEGGGPRRMGKVVWQLAQTYDLEGMTEQQLIAILPREFKRWMDWL